MSLLQMSFSGAVLILIITAVRMAAMDKLPKKTFLFLWGIVIIRLLIPFSVPSPISVYSLVAHKSYAYADTSDRSPINNIIPVIPAVQADTEPTKEFEKGEIQQGEGQKGEGQQAHAQQPLSENKSSVSIWTVVWITVMALCVAFFAMLYLSSLAKFRRSQPVRNDYVKYWLKTHKLMRPIAVRQLENIGTPLTYGIFRPVILLPKETDWENIKQLRYILMHEYVHICRCDILIKLIATLTLCIHWFNPFVWVMYLFLNRDLELSCDESVVRKFGVGSRSTYAKILINMAAQESGLVPFYNGFSKNSVEERITSIMKIKKNSLIAIVTAVAVTVSIAALFATSAKANNPDKNPANQVTAALSPEEAVGIYMVNKDIWTLNPEFAPMQGYAYCLLDLDFDGVLELITSTNEGSMRNSYNSYYKILPETRSVVELTSPDKEGSGGFDLFYADGYPKLLKNNVTNKLFYYCADFLRVTAGESETYYGTLCFEDNALKMDYLFSSYYCEAGAEGNSEDINSYAYYNDNAWVEISETQYNQMTETYFAENADLHLQWKYVDGQEFDSSEDPVQRELLLDAYRGFSYDGFSLSKNKSQTGFDSSDLDSGSMTSAAYAYKEILSGSGQFITADMNHKELNLENIKEVVSDEDWVTAKAIKFTVVDLDADGENEVILWIQANDDPYYGFEVLHYQEGTVYGYTLPYRGFMDLKTDGTFSFSSGAADSGVGRLNFSENGYSVYKLAYSESHYTADNELIIQYFANGEECSAGEVIDAEIQQEAKPNAVWHELTADNVNAAFGD